MPRSVWRAAGALHSCTPDFECYARTDFATAGGSLLMPPNQKIPETPKEAITGMRDELDRLESATWVRDYQGGATMSAGVAVQPQAAQSIQAIGLGFTTLAAWRPMNPLKIPSQNARQNIREPPCSGRRWASPRASRVLLAVAEASRRPPVVDLSGGYSVHGITLQTAQRSRP